ncbi:hypothetical protein LO772_18565 [Yinghuangia sp. ASG 101]|uniref:hypothetical protein n=1 Tax=Yinghuangia sp. ASG 101 TaxID=2896848 RepID=UPI001E2E5FE6|nr:hypothetical protein [Yinghuangia sp. ASG 101]UGQ08982.1 hypothetical protein LO772_18565 [Yinghuangia sp. ASG 101]
MAEGTDAGVFNGHAWSARPPGQKGGALMGETKSKSWGQGYPVGTRVRVQVGLSAGQLGEVADVYGDAHRPPVTPFRWYGVRLANGLRPLYRHDELKPVH